MQYYNYKYKNYQYFFQKMEQNNFILPDNFIKVIYFPRAQYLAKYAQQIIYHPSIFLNWK